MEQVYEKIRNEIFEILKKYKVNDKKVIIKSKVLSPEEAIGNPLHNDYPLIKGKERLLEATINNAKGVAFTDMYGNYEGTLYNILNLPLQNNFYRAIFIATINALFNYLGLIEKTRHCKDETPILCAKELTKFLRKNYGEKIKIFQVGHQPRFTEILSKNFLLKIVDMDKDNIGKIINNVEINDISMTDNFIEWADIIFVTGSTFVNNSAKKFLNITNKPVIFYGVTCAAVSYILNLTRYCPYAE